MFIKLKQEMKLIHEILKNYWGYNNFRPLQQEIITAVINKKDTLAILPTGGGKSLCFQVPALATEGICLVISPLIALMKDQVANLKQKGIPALAIYSGMSFSEVKISLVNAIHGNYKFLYLSPERLESDIFLEHLPSIPVNLIAVDEAHCVSQWGYDFRPPYLRIAALREYLPDVPVIALTASATKEVQVDICDKLAFKNDFQFFQKSFERPNLSYSVFNVPAKQNKLIEIFKKVEGTGIVYCKSRKRTKEIADLLNLNGLPTDFYHAGLPHKERALKQENWINNKTRIIACTNAFGMGIDKGDVRTVVHYDVPDALENYYQEAGRAGRDEKKAYAVLLYYESEIKELKEQINIRFPSFEQIKNVYRALVNYLQIPEGSSEGLYFVFDINAFVKKFKIDISLANYGLKALAQEGLIEYNEQIFLPAKVIFTTTRENLEAFENMNPDYVDIIKGLLRSYEGVFDFPATINENNLAAFIKKDVAQVKLQLTHLNNSAILEYQPPIDNPQIQFLKNRVAVNDLIINKRAMFERKQAYEQRLYAMLQYVNEKKICRSKMIGNYFNDKNMLPCGVCDNCINNNDIFLSNAEFRFISTRLLQMISEKEVNLKDIIQANSSVKKEKIMRVVKYLQEEELLLIKENGIIRAKHKT
ncbi:RecQ family ATP-dependent DNA helicase [soil metagenome]